MSSWPKTYREHAVRLREMAETEVFPSVREQLLALARQYDRRATRVANERASN